MVDKKRANKVTNKAESKFKIRNLHSHVTGFFKKMSKKKMPVTKFYEKRGR
ncbi:MAG: hypothetical protein L6408_03470 [Nanoarchaeota archaeon]|nr:hypothetical protein [Nanoarchaeota archaeon]